MGTFERDGFEYLIGHPITKVEMNASNDILRLTTAFGGSHVFSAYGDCCSHSWINHIDGVAELHSGIVEIEETIESRDDEDDTDDDVKVYFYKLITGLGRVTIEMRNASNGYYGGSLDPCPNHLVSHVTDWKTITEDF